MNRTKKTAVVVLLACLTIVIALAGIAAFPPALAAAQSINLPPVAAWAWALLPDFATLVGMLGALVLNDKRGRRFAVLSIATFALAGAVVQVTHALGDRVEEPPVGLLVAFGLVASLALFLSAETASRVVAFMIPAVEAKPVPRVERKPAEKKVTGKGEKGSNLPPRRDDTTVIEQAREVARRYAREGKRLTVSALQAECRLSWKRAARVHAEVTA
ncbi:hypothetical protein OIE99_29500 [Streptomyces cellulosae]|nr:hypothetical protein OIE99_29500 [Streptomyces cellulosae]